MSMPRTSRRPSLFDMAGRAYHASFAVVFDVVRAAAGAVGLDRVDHLPQGQPVTNELRRIRLHLVLLDEAADSVRRRQRRARFSSAPGRSSPARSGVRRCAGSRRSAARLPE